MSTESLPSWGSIGDNTVIIVPTRRNYLSRLLSVAVWNLVLITGVLQLHAQEMTFELNRARTKIDFSLSASLHTVHGVFQLQTGTIHFNPSTEAVSGTVVADATSAETGNKSRDRKMHLEVLESQRYPQVAFSPTKISGSIDLKGDSTVQVEGVFRLHGDDHPLNLVVPVHISGDTMTAKTRFVIPYVAWGLKNPSTFLLHVSDKVQVNVSAIGRITK
ncbi:MAG: YceI family protein [Acidobacteria bacterium]|nr:YceI family protein [Acidobacteriota bacterium]